MLCPSISYPLTFSLSLSLFLSLFLSPSHTHTCTHMNTHAHTLQWKELLGNKSAACRSQVWQASVTQRLLCCVEQALLVGLLLVWTCVCVCVCVSVRENIWVFLCVCVQPSRLISDSAPVDIVYSVDLFDDKNASHTPIADTHMHTLCSLSEVALRHFHLFYLLFHLVFLLLLELLCGHFESTSWHIRELILLLYK